MFWGRGAGRTLSKLSVHHWLDIVLVHTHVQVRGYFFKKHKKKCGKLCFNVCVYTGKLEFWDIL